MIPSQLSAILDEATLKRLATELKPVLAALPGATRNGKSDWLRYLMGLALAALVAYFTTLSTTKEQIATIKTTEQNHFEEVLRRLDAMQADIRELRGRP